jgi:dipeptidyl-peptidase-4
MKMRILLTALILASGFTAVAQKELTLKDAVMHQYGKFYPSRTVMVKWIPDTKTYSYLSADYQTLKMGSVKKSAATDLISTAELAKATGENFNYVNVLDWKDENNFYTTAGGKYFLVNAAKKTTKEIASMPEGAENDEICFANDKVAYTIENNLFIQDGDKQIQVTKFGPETVSGQAIARSEFGISGGIFWSNTGKYLGFYQKDESEVADYPLLDITTRTGSLTSIKYPMAGEKSEKSAVGIYNLETGKSVYIRPKGNPDDYLTNFCWGPKDEFFYVAEVNRDQNAMMLNKYNAETGEFVKNILEETHPKWVEPEHPAYFINDSEFIWLSEKDGFMNMYLYSAEGEFKKQLTTNKWVTTDIVGHTSSHVYFKGTGEIPTESHYFKVEIESGKQTQITKGGTHNGSFSSDFKYLYDGKSDVNTPNVESILDNNGKTLREVLEAENALAKYKIGTAEYGTIKAADEETDLHYRLIKPSDFDASKKYPVLIYVYGGPHAQLVKNAWYGGASLWMYWMAEQGYLVYTVDNRGSANRGFEFENVIHRRLGTVEMADQMKGVDYLKSLPYVDGERLAVHGWSFGGFMTTSLMLRQDDAFNVGVAGGPVTDWQYYEVMYGERYMDRPVENERGYNDNRLMNYVENLKGKLMLIHGTVDDVVVMQHNLALVKAFVDAGVQVDFFPYPMHPHNVRGKDRVHLMEKVLTYIIDNNK